MLRKYRKDGHYTDCFAVELPQHITQEQFVQAFYTTALFKLERLTLKWAVARPSSDAQAQQLAAGQAQSFAAWSVEDQTDDQLLLRDFQGRTRSWLMTLPLSEANAVRTRLYFGSAVVPIKSTRTGQSTLGLAFKALLGFHKLYSIALLAAAARTLRKH